MLKLLQMAISITINRTDNTFKVSAEVADTGKLKIYYNDSAIYDNLSGATADITAGAETSIGIPLVNGAIPLGVYRFDFDASAGASYDVSCNFQIEDITAVIDETIDTLAPSFIVDDNTDYTIDNGTISSASRTLTTGYPQGVAVADLTATAADITTDLDNTTYLLYEGVMQTDLSAALTYTIATTTGYTINASSSRQGFTYTSLVEGYSSSPQLTDNDMNSLYDCLETFRLKVNDAETNNQSNYGVLKADYSYAAGLLSQYEQAVNTNNVGDLDSIKSAIERTTGCVATSVNSTSSSPSIIYGLGLSGTVNEMTKVSLTITAAEAVVLNGTPIKILTTDASYIYTPLGGSIVCDTAQASGTPSGALTLKVHQGSAYDATEEIMGCVVPTTVDAADDYANFSVVSGKKLSAGGEGWYVGAAADDSEWDGVFTVVVYYSLTKVA